MTNFNAPQKTNASRNRLWMMTAIALGAFMSHFTAGVVNVSLPQFMDYFQADLGKITWITTGYLLIITALLPIMGKLGDRYGYRNIHNWGYLIFTVGSILVAFSPNLPMLLALRIVQAIGAAMFQATNIALITTHVEKEKRGRALGIVSTAVALGGMSGPVVGGFIAEGLSWQWLFLSHVPVAIVATLMANSFIPAGKKGNSKGAFDHLGAVLFAAVISMAIVGLLYGREWGWTSGEILYLALGLVLLLLLLIWWERRQSVPFLPLQALRIPIVAGGLLISCASFVLSNSILVIMPFYLVGAAGLSPMTAGYILAAYPISLAIAGPAAGYLSDRLGSSRLMLGGLSCMGCGFLMFLLYLNQLPVGGIAALFAVIGVGMGLIASPNNSFIMRHTPGEHVGAIGGMIALTRNAGMVFGSALALAVWNGNQTLESRGNVLGSFFIILLLICIVSIALLAFIYKGKRRETLKSY
jgi:EmrB/QacA subfamily drug resistance transporter